ncbi:MAG: glycosyltransferase [Candidatus Deferrimicrobiaceae bacterium]
MARQVRGRLIRAYNRPVKNHFGSRYDRAVLLSYITMPFRRGASVLHTNSLEVLEIARVFDELGYQVDAVEYDWDGRIDFRRYSVILGFGDPLIRSFYDRIRPIITIYYGTGMHVQHQNAATLERVQDVFNRKGIWLLDSARVVEKTYSVQTTLVHAMIVLGNDTVLESYRKHYAGKIYTVSPSYYKVIEVNEVLDNKDFATARRHFCWFGGPGMIHKGLDLLLETFKNLPGYNLHVCGPVEKEPRFQECFRQGLYHTENIHTHGFVRLDSPLFREILAMCAFIVFPSCSEGAPSSVINVMGNGGLIPVVTRETGVETGDFGVLIADTTLSAVRQAVLEAGSLEKEEVAQRSARCVEHTICRHSIGAYYLQMKNTIMAILGVPG